MVSIITVFASPKIGRNQESGSVPCMRNRSIASQRTIICHPEMLVESFFMNSFNSTQSKHQK